MRSLRDKFFYIREQSFRLSSIRRNREIEKQFLYRVIFSCNWRHLSLIIQTR